MLNVLGGSGSAIPAAFDIPLSPSQVLAIAGGFIQPGCDLGVPGKLNDLLFTPTHQRLQPTHLSL